MRVEMKTSLLVATLLRADDVRFYEVRHTPEGWESSARENQRVVEARHYTEWHRVERSLARFKHEITVLQARGWRLGSLEGSGGAMHAHASGTSLQWCCGDTRCPSVRTSSSEPGALDCPVRALNLESDGGATDASCS
jgi:hypothetical protein